MYKSQRIAIGLTLSLICSPLWANSAAPRVVKAMPSWAIGGKAEGITVLGEDLTIHCHFTFCDVKAQYRIDSKQASKGPLEFRFVLPSNAKISPALNDKPIAAGDSRELAFEQLDPEWKKTNEIHLAHEKGAKVFLAHFSSALPQGTSVLSVAYTQPLALSAHKGYIFSGASAYYTFHYILSPLKEWVLKPDFALSVTVTWDVPARHWWHHIFGTGGRDVTCTGKDSGTDILNSTQEVHFNFDKNFPDDFFCYAAGDPELNRVYSNDEELLEKFTSEQQKP